MMFTEIGRTEKFQEQQMNGTTIALKLPVVGILDDDQSKQIQETCAKRIESKLIMTMTRSGAFLLYIEIMDDSVVVKCP